jgi:hypothetical protein
MSHRTNQRIVLDDLAALAYCMPAPLLQAPLLQAPLLHGQSRLQLNLQVIILFFGVLLFLFLHQVSAHAIFLHNKLACTRARARAHTHTHTHTQYVYVHPHIYIHTYMHAYIHTYMHEWYECLKFNGGV